MNAAAEQRSPRVRAPCDRGADASFLSLVSAWEMQIKQQRGKLQLSPTATRMIEMRDDWTLG